MTTDADPPALPDRALRAAVEAAEPPTESEVAAALGAADAWPGDDGDAYPAVERAREAGRLVEHDTGAMFPELRLAGETETDESAGERGEEPEASDADPRGHAAEPTDHDAGGDGLPDFTELFDAAQDRAGVVWWEPVPEPALREVLRDHGLEGLLDGGRIHRMNRWKWADLADRNDDEPDRRYYYARGDEPRVEEFRRFHELLTAEAPDDYTPHYFRVERAGKAPATQFGSWKTEEARLTLEEAVAWLRKGGNVGLGGRPDGPLVNIDIDDGEETDPDDLPPTLRARSRSRGGWHGWGFDVGDEPIPNIPTDDAGEVRTDWQYVVAPGSFVASASEEIPDDHLDGDPGYYTIEAADPVARIEYDDLPAVFREHDTDDHDHADDPAAPDADPADGAADRDDGGDGDYRTRSAVVDVTAKEVVQGEGGDTDDASRWTALFHGSSTSANMSLSNQGRIQCWRHNVAHGGLQALAVLSELSPSGSCQAIGAGHQRSNAGGCRYAGDWRLLWWAWHYAKGAGYVPDDDPIPFRVLVELAVADGVVDRDALVERESDDGGTYTGLPDADAYNAALEHVREEYDRDPGRDPVEPGTGDGDGPPPTARDVTLDPGIAHRAARAVTPDDLDDPLGDLADGDTWRCPSCAEPIAVDRAAAIALGLVRRCDAPLDADDYTRAYNYARDCGAPLPEYVNSATATGRWDVVTGALRELSFHHLDRDALASEVTATGDDVAGDATLALDPAWRESESGESVIVYENGTVYEAHPDHEGTLDPLRFLALDAGADYDGEDDDPPLSWDDVVATDGDPTLEGERFREAYRLARQRYGAPLPAWDWGAANHTPALPPIDALVEERDDADARLQAAYDDVADLYADAASDPGATVERVLPGLGKTDNVFRQADDHPALYTAGRRDLMADAVDRAAEHGADAYVLPTFAELGPPSEVVEAGVAAVREHGQELLRDRWQLVDVVDDRLAARGDTDRQRAPDPTDYEPDDDGDDVDLERESCATADGEHGRALWLAVHVARQLGYPPRYIHTHDTALFGDALPCQDPDHAADPDHDHADGDPDTDDAPVDDDQESGDLATALAWLDRTLGEQALRRLDRRGDDTDESPAGDPHGDLDDGDCAYSRAWDRATDPDRPFDVLVGHYTLAHVEGARTYYTRGDDGRPESEPRTVVLDEFPGDDYGDTFGDEFADMAAWLAGCLRADVDDRQGLFQNASDLWADQHVRAWLEGDTDPEAMPELARAAAGLDLAGDVLDAVDDAEWLLEHRAAALADLGVADALERLVDAAPEWDPATVRSVRADLVAAVDAPGNRGGHARVMSDLADLADHAALRADADRPLTDRLDDHLDAEHVAGDLATLAERAVDAYRERADRAPTMLENARTALRGGDRGVEELAAYADDGHAHPEAHALLYGVLAPADDDGPATTIATDQYGFEPEPGARLDRVTFGRRTVLVDRNHHGAYVLAPPSFTAAGGDNPVVGLDATARRRLWALAIGCDDLEVRDIHDTDRHRERFLREVYGLRVVQTSPNMNTYEGDPSGKNFDDDVATVREAAEQYGGAVLENGGALDDAPAVVTTQVVEETVDELHDVAAAVDHYGNLKGTERLKGHRLAALLGCQHYGDQEVERWAALAGEAVTRSGHGTRLDYGSPVANTALRHMREDQVMQAALRFGRDTDGAVVLAHTAALRDDLPVVAEGTVMRTFAESAQAVAEVTAELVGLRFTAADVRRRLDRRDVDLSARSVRRHLAELAGAGYLEREEHGPGRAHEYRTVEAAPDAEVDLPGEADLGAAEGDVTRTADIEVSYTVAVRVPDGEPGGGAVRRRPGALLEPPDPATGAAPPG